MKKNVYITGGSGLVGTAFKNSSHDSINWHPIPGPSTGGPDFLDRKQTFDFFEKSKADAIVHTAARVGGIRANMENPLDFYSENTRINVNVLDAAAHFGIKKCISFLSTCVYPDNTTFPLSENKIHLGAPHSSNFAYAYAKRMLDIHSRAIKSQLGFNYFCVSPNNLYGINDNFDLENSHVIPAIIRKMYDANRLGNNEVKLWGSGTPLREFTFADDIPDIIGFLLTRNHNIDDVINIGNTMEEVTINKVARLIRKCLGYNMNVIWDTSQPTGQLRKPSSSEKLEALGYDLNSMTKIEDGLTKTITWFLKSYPKIRGIK